MTTLKGPVARIASVSRTVPDLDAALGFYQDALGFEPHGSALEVSERERCLLGLDDARVSRQEMRLRQQRITLLHFVPQGRPYPPESTASDLWFQHCAVVVGDIAAACAKVMHAGAVPITQGGPQRLPANTGGVTAFKFRDPFGHPWELLALPTGVGAPVWHMPHQPLTLGIDHTAIAVSGLDASRQFYRDILGLSIVERTHNRGAEQTRLDAVSNDDVDVLALNPGELPPHLELLAYRTGTRRRLPGSHPADAAVTRTLAIGDVDAVAERLIRNGSHGFRHGTWQDRPAIAFQDPDGHAWICHKAPGQPSTG